MAPGFFRKLYDKAKNFGKKVVEFGKKAVDTAVKVYDKAKPFVKAVVGFIPGGGAINAGMEAIDKIRPILKGGKG